MFNRSTHTTQQNTILLYIKIKHLAKEKKFFLLLIAFVTFFAVIPLLSINICGHDTQFHLSRIESLAQEIKMSNYFPRIYSTDISGNGYATPLFYGDLLLLIPAFLYAFFGIDIYISLQLFMVFIVFAVSISMYLCTYKITDSKYASFCSAILFTLSSYFCTDIFTRSAIGEAQAFIFLPITFLGFYTIIYKECENWYLLPIGLAFMIHGHLLSSVMTVFVLSCFLIFSAKTLIKNPKKTIYLLLSILVFLGLSIDFILPLAEQLHSSNFFASSDYMMSDLYNEAMPIWNIFFDFTIFTNYYRYTRFTPNGISIAIILLIVYIFFYRKVKDKSMTQSLIISILLLIMSTKLFPWKIFNSLLGVIQLPWRLLTFSTFLISFSAGIYFCNIGKNKTSKILMACIIAASLFSYCINLVPSFTQHNKFTGSKITYDYKNDYNADYLPISDNNTKKTQPYRDELVNMSNVINCSNPEITTNFTRNNRILTVNFKNNTGNDTTIEVPILMYKGYTAKLNDGTYLECDYGQYNRIKVSINDIPEGTFTVEYTGTKIQHISRTISIASSLLITIYIVVINFRNRHNLCTKTTLNGSE